MNPFPVELTIRAILMIISGVFNLTLGLSFLVRSKGRADSIFFFLISIGVFLWAIGHALLEIFPVHYQNIHIITSIIYIGAALIPVSLVFFATTLGITKKEIKYTVATYLSVISYLLIVVIVSIPDAVLGNIYTITKATKGIRFGPFYQLYVIYIVIVFLLGFYTLAVRYYTNQPKSLTRTHILYIFIAAVSVGIIGMATNLVLPIYGIFTYFWVGPSSAMLIVIFIGYVMAKHNFTDFRSVISQSYAFMIPILSLLGLFFIRSIISLVLVLASITVMSILSMMLLKKISSEIEYRKQVETLAKKLQKANKRLKELDQQKSEFLSIATHQLRGPLAGIRGHLSLILDGSYGKVSTKASEIILKVFESSGLLAQTINDFLNVSRIEQGSMQYDKKEFKVGDLLETIVEEIETLAKKRGLKLTLTNNCKENECLVHADYAKINHIFFNLIDNAIKYTEQGWIKISVVAHDKKVRIEVSDSGVGIDQDEIDNLFEKFVRARGASGINVNGTGLGLYVARQMVEAHDGKIWAESAGKGKGSTFVVELPVK